MADRDLFVTIDLFEQKNMQQVNHFRRDSVLAHSLCYPSFTASGYSLHPRIGRGVHDCGRRL